MKIRIAKKVIYSKHWRRKCQKLRPKYYDEKRGKWVYPSWHDIPIPTYQKARRKWFSYNTHYANVMKIKNDKQKNPQALRNR